MWGHNDAPTAETLAHIVVGVSLQLDGDACKAERLADQASQLQTRVGLIDHSEK